MPQDIADRAFGDRVILMETRICIADGDDLYSL